MYCGNSDRQIYTHKHTDRHTLTHNRTKSESENFFPKEKSRGESSFSKATGWAAVVSNAGWPAARARCVRRPLPQKAAFASLEEESLSVSSSRCFPLLLHCTVGARSHSSPLPRAKLAAPSQPGGRAHRAERVSLCGLTMRLKFHLRFEKRWWPHLGSSW